MKPSSFATAGDIAAVPAPGGESAREWFSASELAALGLPGLPGDKRSLNRRAKQERWETRTGANGAFLARERRGVGGGVEFHVSLLPADAQLELVKRGLSSFHPAPREAEAPAAAAWRWFDAQSDKVKDEAKRRAAIVADVDIMLAAGMTKTAAVAEAARRHGAGKAAVWDYLTLARGVSPHDRLPALAPNRKAGGREAEMADDLWRIFLSDYLRLEKPTLTSCYDRTAAIAAARGESMPSERSIRRKLERDVDARVLKLRREGEEALRRSIPAQRRTVAHLHAMELVNIDGHKFDVFVRTGDGRVIRPIMVTIQDVHTRKVLAWRIGGEESAVQTRLCFADLFEKYGIPKGCLLDNGRAFASKWITGGANSRFRFKIREEEPTGLLTGLGIQIHWATPYRGQSKPIERAFRDMCDRIAKHPAFAGAYVGNNPMAKPENYGSRAVNWAEFVAVVNAGIAAHNAKLGRRTETAHGRSFDEVFAESYASAPIGRATPEQMRLALLAGEQKTVDARTGEIKLFGNRYWSPDCGQFHGQKVTVRFDPDNLLRDVHLYDLKGRYLCAASVFEDVQFLDAAEAKATAKAVAEYRRRIRDGAAAHELLSAAQVASLQVDAPEPDLPAPQVVRMVRHRGQTAAALKVAHQPEPENSTVFSAIARLRPVE